MTRRPPIAAVVALGLVVVGLGVTLLRPVAPAVGSVETDLDLFAAGVEAAVNSFRGPLPWVGVAATLLELGVVVGLVASRPGRALVTRFAGPAESRGRRLLVRVGLVAALGWALVEVVKLPLRWWVGVVHVGEHGLRTGGAASWWGPALVATALEILAAGGVAVLVVAVMRRWPDDWHWHLVWAGTLAGAAVVLVWPWVVAPLLRPQTPLPDGPTAEAIGAVLDEAGFEDARVVVAEESTRTAFVNAQVVGVGPTRTVVVWDTLLELPPEQVAHVVAHEAAHQQAFDVARGASAAGVGLLPLALLLRAGFGHPRLRAAVGARSRLDPRLVAVGLLVVVGFRVVADPVALWQARRVEAAADHRSLELTDDPAAMIAFQRALVVGNLATIDRPAWQRLLFATHPDAEARIERAVAYARDNDLPLPDLATLPGAPSAR